MKGNIYYVYAYLRAKDSANGKAGTPYYIGKGNGRRAFDKCRIPPCPSDRNRVQFIVEGVSESNAFQIEVLFIHLHGRIDIGTGYLRNRTNGGDGASGYKQSEETKIKRANSNRGKKRTEEFKDKLRGKSRPEEVRLRIKVALIGKKHSPETLDKIKEKRRAAVITPEWRKKMSEAQYRRHGREPVVKDFHGIPPKSRTKHSSLSTGSTYCGAIQDHNLVIAQE